MKLSKIILFSLVVAISFSSCLENRMKVSDIEEDTPTNADSVLAPSKSQPFTVEQIQKWDEEAPILYQR